MSAKKETSIRRCSRVLGQRRPSIYYKYKRKNEDEEIAKILKEKAVEKPNWGFRLLFYWIRNQGKKWNGKRVYRVYKAENRTADAAKFENTQSS